MFRRDPLRAALKDRSREEDEIHLIDSNKAKGLGTFH